MAIKIKQKSRLQNQQQTRTQFNYLLTAKSSDNADQKSDLMNLNSNVPLRMWLGC